MDDSYFATFWGLLFSTSDKVCVLLQFRVKYAEFTARSFKQEFRLFARRRRLKSGALVTRRGVRKQQGRGAL